jgi:6-pyruvoyltetrahydropterin/6-carboxytetrahydropterin synthase
MNFELAQTFYFEAAHTLARDLETEGSRRIHGHTYTAEVTVSGAKEPETGMVVDLAQLRATVERVRALLDHQFLDEVKGLGAPTLENLCVFLWRAFEVELTGVCAVRVARVATGDSCTMRRSS